MSYHRLKDASYVAQWHWLCGYTASEDCTDVDKCDGQSRSVITGAVTQNRPVETSHKLPLRTTFSIIFWKVCGADLITVCVSPFHSLSMPNGPRGCGLAWHGRLSYACVDGMAVMGINGGCDVRGCGSVLVRRLRCHRCLRVFSIVSDVSSVNVAVVDVVDVSSVSLMYHHFFFDVFDVVNAEMSAMLWID